MAQQDEQPLYEQEDCDRLDECPHRFGEPDAIGWAIERMVVPLIPIAFMYLFRRDTLMHSMGFIEALLDIARGPEPVFYAFIVLAGAFVECVATLARAGRDRVRIRAALVVALVILFLFAADRLVTMLTYYDAITPYDEFARKVVTWTIDHPGVPYPSALPRVPYPVGLGGSWATRQLLLTIVAVALAIGAAGFTRYTNGRLAALRRDAAEENAPPGATAVG